MASPARTSNLCGIRHGTSHACRKQRGSSSVSCEATTGRDHNATATYGPDAMAPLRGYPASLLKEAFQPLPLTPKGAPVAPPERFVSSRQCFACAGYGRLRCLRLTLRRRGPFTEYDLESLSQRRFHRQAVSVADDDLLELRKVRPFGY